MTINIQGNDKCSPTIIRISDRRSLVEDYQRPQVIISGAIHGDERVVSNLNYLHKRLSVKQFQPAFDLIFPDPTSHGILWLD